MVQHAGAVVLLKNGHLVDANYSLNIELTASALGDSEVARPWGNSWLVLVLVRLKAS